MCTAATAAAAVTKSIVNDLERRKRRKIIHKIVIRRYKAAAKDFGKNNWKVFNASTYLPRWAKYIVNAISVFKTPIFYDSFIRLGRFRTLFPLFSNDFTFFSKLR